MVPVLLFEPEFEFEFGVVEVEAEDSVDEVAEAVVL
jgi:hypothetical protein